MKYILSSFVGLAFFTLSVVGLCFIAPPNSEVYTLALSGLAGIGGLAASLHASR